MRGLRSIECHSKILMQKIILILIIFVCLYLGLMAYAWAFSDKMIFPHVPASYTEIPGLLKLAAEDGETIAAYYIAAEVKGAPLMIYHHGNGEDIGHCRDFLQVFADAGIAVLAYDYPGYGQSTGKPTEKGCYAAAAAAYLYATKALGFAPERISHYGRSLGSGPACWLAARFPVGSLILDSAFSSAFRVVTGRKLLAWDKFDNLARLRQIRCPVVVIHGTEDAIVPFGHALKNYEAIGGPKAKLWVEGGNHNNLIDIGGAAYWDAVLPYARVSSAISQ